jgi:dTDP-4-dehydrorhamnose reductase
MRILVFGKSGQVATELARIGDDNMTCLGRDIVDLSNPSACAAIITATDADVIINAAAYTAVDMAEDEEVLATTINGTSVSTMAHIAAARDIPFLHISTDYVFDGSGSKPWQPNDTTRPINAYGRSKLVGELGVAAANGTYAMMRTSWVYSSHGKNFVKTMLRLGAERNVLSIVNDQIGGPTSAADIAGALMRMAQSFHQGQGQSGFYHFASGPDISWADFAVEIFKQAKLTVDVTGIPSAQYPTPAARPANSRMDCSDITHAFGVKRPDWRVSLNKVLTELGAI